MEGGRSRTGKLRPPRYGLLAYVAEAVARGRARDACLVPVAITYDQLREVSAMAAEQGGAAKKKPEGLSWLASYARAQLTRVGTVHICFAEPLSVADALGPGGQGDDPDARRLAVQKMAFEVAVRINRVTPVTATALVTLALLGVRDRALTLGQVRGVLEPLCSFLAERGLPYSGDVLRTGTGVRQVLDALAQQIVVTIYTGGEEPVYAIERGQHLVAAFYRNSAIHHFVHRAIAELVLLSKPEDRWDEATRLRDLLKFEFFFPDKASYREELGAELRRLHPSWETVADGRAVLERARVLVASRVLRSFLDAQLVVAERLAAHPPGQPVADSGLPRRVRRRRAADAAAGAAARAGVAVAGAVLQRAQARGEPGSDRPGRRGAGRGQARLCRAAARPGGPADHDRRDRCNVPAGGGRCRTLASCGRKSSCSPTSSAGRRARGWGRSSTSTAR